jgi:hypothetical protein
MRSAVVLVECSGAKIGGLDGLSDYMRFTNPGSLGMREYDGYDVPRSLEGPYKGVHVRRGLVRGRAVIVHDLCTGSVSFLQWLGFESLGGWNLREYAY